jgi:hypothetical protein
MCKVKNRFIILAPLVAMVISSCSTTQKTKIAGTILTGAAIGAIYGLSRKEMKEENAMMFASQGAAIGALAGLYYHDPDKEIEKLQTKLDQATQFQKDMEKRSSLFGISKSQSSVGLDEISNLKTSGWQEYKADGYYRVAPNLIYHHVGLLTPDTKKLNEE